MQPIYSLYVLTLFAAAIGGLLLLWYAQRYWDAVTAPPFSLLMLCIVWWALFAALSATAASAEMARFLGVQVRFTAVIFVSTAALLFAFAYTGRTEWLRPRRVALLLVIPAITLLLNWSSDSHRLFVDNVFYEEVGGVWLRTVWSRGPWFRFVYLPYNLLLVLVTLFLLVDQARHSRYPYRQQAILVVAGFLVPTIAGIIAIFDLLPGPDLDLIVLGFLFMGLTFAWALSRYQLLDFVPVARGAIIENMTDAIMVLDNDNRLVELNPAMCGRLGLTRRQALGLNAEELFARWPALVEQYKDVENGRFVIPIPLNKRTLHLDMQISGIDDKNGQIIGRLVVLRDITQIKETELALEETLQRFSVLLQVAGSLTDFTKLEDLFRTTVNRVAWAMPADRVVLIVFNEDNTGIVHHVVGGPGADEIQQAPFSELMAGLTGWVLLQSKPALSLKGQPDIRESDAVRKRRRESNSGSVVVVPLLFRERVLGTLTVINRLDQRDFNWNDVELLQAVASQTAVAIENTRLYIAQQEQVKALQESNEDLEAFSHMVAHDLKGPLTTINTYSDLVLTMEKDKEIPRERMVKYFDAIYRTGRKMSDIINDLLLLAKIRRQGDVLLKPLEMSPIVEEALSRLDWQIDEASAAISRPDSWPDVVGNALWVEEIWVNYISNALKYGGERPEIALGCDSLDGQVHFWVMDNGVGMTAEEQSRLFVEFSRVGEQKIKGHGLGLAIVRRIAKRMGGEVWVESQPGQGSTFYFSLQTPT